ncbi:hypothetical protein NA57DRAFT_62202 [Rhizodiscina lignyota]|uniref:Expansin-like EG45 domain-containing protein n=1 Tax=Rhizodiscina lignyota TaxID=1504668 RepID=A0A9P4I3U3_9PEZI|nr:hypothetical protein NA57DRAFT_62202 [Rhizodiscina lignyota]
MVAVSRYLRAATVLFPLAALAENTTYETTFTWYGTGDQNGSPNCNSNTVACGFYTFPGYAAAVSQNLYGAGPGQGIGPACGTCWRLTIDTDMNGNTLKNSGNSIVVIVNNLCPAVDPKYGDNPLCAQPNLSTANQYGGLVDFNLCNDDSARGALFGDSGVGLAVGSATQVDCSEWQGTKKTDCGSDCGNGPSTPSTPSTPSESVSCSTPTESSSSSGQIGGNAAPLSQQQGVGAAGKNVVLCIWGLLLPLVVMLKV